MDISCENSSYADSFTKSHINQENANINHQSGGTTNLRYNTRSSSVRNESNNTNVNENPTVYDYVNPNFQAETGSTPRYNTRSSMNSNKRRFYGGKPPLYNIQNSTKRKQKRRKKSNKSKLIDYCCQEHKISVQKLKYDFKQLSPEDQRMFMEEMATDTNLKEVLPMREYASDKELKIYNIEQYFVQIDPIAGDYVTEPADM